MCLPNPGTAWRKTNPKTQRQHVLVSSRLATVYRGRPCLNPHHTLMHTLVNISPSKRKSISKLLQWSKHYTDISNLKKLQIVIIGEYSNNHLKQRTWELNSIAHYKGPCPCAGFISLLWPDSLSGSFLFTFLVSIISYYPWYLKRNWPPQAYRK